MTNLAGRMGGLASLRGGGLAGIIANLQMQLQQARDSGNLARMSQLAAQIAQLQGAQTGGTTASMEIGGQSINVPLYGEGGQLTQQGLSALLAQEYQSQFDEAKAGNEALEQELRSGYGEMIPRTQDAYATNLETFRGGQSNLLGGYGDLSERIGQGYQDRYKRGMGYLSDYGAQMRADIDEGFYNQAQGTKQELARRGLTNTTMTSSAAIVNERERSKEQRRLAEDLAKLQAEYDARLSGEALAQQGTIDQQRLAAMERGLGAEQNILAGGVNAVNQADMARMGMLERITHEYPDYQQLATLSQGLGAAGDLTGFGAYGAESPAYGYGGLASYGAGGRPVVRKESQGAVHPSMAMQTQGPMTTEELAAFAYGSEQPWPAAAAGTRYPEQMLNMITRPGVDAHVRPGTALAGMGYFQGYTPPVSFPLPGFMGPGHSSGPRNASKKPVRSRQAPSPRAPHLGPSTYSLHSYDAQGLPVSRYSPLLASQLAMMGYS